MRRLAISLGLTMVLAFCLAPALAHANRALLSKEALKTSTNPTGLAPPPEGQIEGPCGAAVSAGGGLLVSEYYHRVVDTFVPEDKEFPPFLFRYSSQLTVGVPAPEGPCQLALAPGGALYANIWHQSVQRLSPSPQSFDEANSTGVAVDASGNVYANDRTHVAVYEPSGEALKDGGGEAIKLGLGSLTDAYGLAINAGKVYVPDAATNTVKVYELAQPDDPIETIAPPGGFNSLTDAAITVDPTNGHILVLDNLQPGYEHPQAAVDEFDAEGNYLGQLGSKVIDGGPSGMAVDPASANLYVTSGNTEGANAFAFGPYSESGPLSAPSGPDSHLTPGSFALAGPPPAPKEDKASQGPSASASEVVQKGKVRVAFDGQLTPHRLPRSGTAPVRVAVGAKISPTKEASPPQLRKISIAINRHGHLDPTGLPVCALDDIQPSSTTQALAACRSSLIGEGTFSAKVLLGQQAPFPSAGKIYAFNGRAKGKPAIFAHVYGTKPVPTSLTLSFTVGAAKGTYGTVLATTLPEVTGNSAYITGLSISLGRNYTYRGQKRSYVSAGCPAPKGFSKASFPFAKARFAFRGAKSLSSTLVRSCGVRG